MANSRWVVVGMVLLGVVAAVVAWWFRYEQTRRALRFWGTREAQIIRAADKTEYWELTRAEAGANTSQETVITLSGVPYVARRRSDVSRVAGLLHVRDALLTDETFRWIEEQTAQIVPSDALDALVFYGDKQSVVVVFDRSTWRVWAPPRQHVLDASPKAALWKRWFAERKQERR